MNAKALQDYDCYVNENLLLLLLQYFVIVKLK